jgi:hypothetical protein
VSPLVALAAGWVVAWFRGPPRRVVRFGDDRWAVTADRVPLCGTQVACRATRDAHYARYAKETP